MPLRLLIKALRQRGFLFVSQNGSHAKFVNGRFIVIVPMHGKEVPHGTLRSIARQAGLSEETLRKP